MIPINLFDNEFPGQPSAVNGKMPRTLQFVRDQMAWGGITIFTDRMAYSPLVEQVQSPIKMGWFLEARCFRPWYYERAHELRPYLDALLTYDADLLERYPGWAHFVPRAGVWTPPALWGMHPKSKTVSLLLSEKQSTEGHRLRHEIADRFPDLDLYGARGTPIGTDKARAFKDYRYSIIVEACWEENLFTEHLLDCIAFGTIPIYKGCPNIGDFFSRGGMMEFGDLNELNGILGWLKGHGEALYEFKTPSARLNFGRLDKYEITEDWIAAHVLPAFERVAA